MVDTTGEVDVPSNVNDEDKTKADEEDETSANEEDETGGDDDECHETSIDDPAAISSTSCSSIISRSNVSQRATLKLDLTPTKCENDHVIKTVKNKADRVKLEAYECSRCAAYYKSLNLTEEQLKEKLHKCSRHRGTTGRVAGSSTPPGFWDIKMPSTPEAIEQGMITIGTDKSDMFKKLGVKEGVISKGVPMKRKSDETPLSSQTSPLTASPISSRKLRRASSGDE